MSTFQEDEKNRDVGYIANQAAGAMADLFKKRGYDTKKFTKSYFFNSLMSHQYTASNGVMDRVKAYLDKPEFNDESSSQKDGKDDNFTASDKMDVLSKVTTASTYAATHELDVYNVNGVNGSLDQVATGTHDAHPAPVVPTPSVDGDVLAAAVGSTTNVLTGTKAPATTSDASKTGTFDDPRFIAIDNNTQLSIGVKSKAEQAILNGNQSSVKDLIAWFSTAEAGGGAAPASATSTPVSDANVDPRVAAIKTSDASQSVKDKALAAISSGNTSSASDLMVWFNTIESNDAAGGGSSGSGAATNTQAAIDPRIAVINGSGASQSVKNKALNQVSAGNASSGADLITWYNAEESNAAAAAAVSSSNASTSTQPAVDPRINAINSSGASQSVKDQAIAQVNSGNASTAADLVTWFKAVDANASAKPSGFAASTGGTPDPNVGAVSVAVDTTKFTAQ